MKTLYAILDESGNVLTNIPMLEWAHWFERNRAQQRIGNDEIEGHLVSTVFLGLNHQFHPKAKPLWFETMVFGPYATVGPFGPERNSLWHERCETKSEAVIQHQEGVQWLKSYLTEKLPPKSS